MEVYLAEQINKSTEEKNWSLTLNVTDAGAKNGSNVVVDAAHNEDTYFYVALALSWLNAILIIGLNTAVIVTIVRYKKRSRLYFLLLNLAIADLLTGILDALPHSIERSVGLSHLQMAWVFGEAMCKIQRTAANMPMTASNYILAATSLDRAMVIYKPMMSVRRGSTSDAPTSSHILQKAIIISCWVFSFVVSAPYLHLMTTKPLYLMKGYVHCTLDWGQGVDHLQMWKIMIVVMFVYIFTIPFIVIVVSYAILLTAIYKRTTMATQTKLTNQTPISGSRVFNRSLPKSKLKSVKLTCGIILGFFFSWMVFFVVIFLNIFANFNHQFVLIAMTFYFWNSVANPILFFIYHRRQPRRVAYTSTCSSDVTRNTISSELRSTTRNTSMGASSFSVSSARCMADEAKC